MSDTGKSVVTTDRAPAPAHVFSQGVRKGGLLQVSGQGPMDPDTNTYIAHGDVAAQTTRTLENIRAILEAGDSSVEDVLMFRVYLTDRSLFPAMNEAYGDLRRAARAERSAALPHHGVRRPPAPGDAGGDRRAGRDRLSGRAPARPRPVDHDRALRAQIAPGGVAGPLEYTRYESRTGALPGTIWISKRIDHDPRDTA